MKNVLRFFNYIVTIVNFIWNTGTECLKKVFLRNWTFQIDGAIGRVEK